MGRPPTQMEAGGGRLPMYGLLVLMFVVGDFSCRLEEGKTQALLLFTCNFFDSLFAQKFEVIGILICCHIASRFSLDISLFPPLPGPNQDTQALKLASFPVVLVPKRKLLVATTNWLSPRFSILHSKHCSQISTSN